MVTMVQFLQELVRWTLDGDVELRDEGILACIAHYPSERDAKLRMFTSVSEAKCLPAAGHASLFTGVLSFSRMAADQ